MNARTLATGFKSIVLAMIVCLGVGGALAAPAQASTVSQAATSVSTAPLTIPSTASPVAPAPVETTIPATEQKKKKSFKDRLVDVLWVLYGIGGMVLIVLIAIAYNGLRRHG